MADTSPSVAGALRDMPDTSPSVAGALRDVPDTSPSVAGAFRDVPDTSPSVAETLRDVLDPSPSVAGAFRDLFPSSRFLTDLEVEISFGHRSSRRGRWKGHAHGLEQAIVCHAPHLSKNPQQPQAMLISSARW